MEPYATPEELAAYVHPDDDPPAAVPDATVLLRSASQLVTDAIAGAVYAVDDDGHPTLAANLTAVKDATMEQASAWSLNGIDPRLGEQQVARRIKSKSLGNGAASTTYEDGSSDLLRLASGQYLTDAAWLILANAGLTSNRASTNGGAVERFNVEQRYFDPTTGNWTP